MHNNYFDSTSQQSQSFTIELYTTNVLHILGTEVAAKRKTTQKKI